MLIVLYYIHTFLPPSLIINHPPSLSFDLFYLSYLGVGMYVQTLDHHWRQIGSLRFTKEKRNDEGLFRKNQCVSNRTSFQSYAVSEGVSFLDGWMDVFVYDDLRILTYSCSRLFP